MEILIVISIIVLAMYLFITERFAASVVALIVLCALMLVTLAGPFVPGFNPARWLRMSDCTLGFSSSAMLSVAGMFVLSAGLQKTGVISSLASLLYSRVKSPLLIVLALLLLAAGSSAFINNTAAVAVFLPILVATCHRSNIAPSSTLIPLSYASQVGGVCTLIGTSTNLLVASIAEGHGMKPFSVFEFAPLGLLLMVVAVAYFALLGRFLLPKRQAASYVSQDYQVSFYASELKVSPGSELIGRRPTPGVFGDKHTARLIGLRHGDRLSAPDKEPSIEEGDVLVVETKAEDLLPLCQHWRLQRYAELKFGKTRDLSPSRLGVAELVIPARSNMIGHTLAEVGFSERYGCIAVGLHHEAARILPEKLSDSVLKAGDALLVLGESGVLSKFRSDPDFLVLDRVQEPSLRKSKRPLAIGIFVFSIALAALGVVPVLFSLLLGCILLLVTGCVLLDEAFEAIDWKVILLLAAMLPMGKAIEVSGAAALIAEYAATAARPLGSYGALAVIYLVTATMTEFMSNNAAAVLLSPVAIAVGVNLGLDPKPLLIAVCFAASTSFCTPVGYQTNAMVQNPGGYRFSDYLRAGLPLNLLFLVVSVLCIPLFWPF